MNSNYNCNMFEDSEDDEVYDKFDNEAHSLEIAGTKMEKRNLQAMELNTNKAGMEGLNTTKINEIIQKSSEGSKFYVHKQKCQERIDSKVAQLKSEVNKITEEQIRKSEDEMTKISLEMEKRRDLSKTIVHIDMDMFYAAVEMRDNPSLKDKPMAVGGASMLSTSNYAARKYGVRAAMPGFIARKLCSELIIVPPNFDKYKEVSSQVQEIFEEYDPQFCPMSLDEAYLDITDYLQVNAEKYAKNDSNSSLAELVVEEIRKKIEEKTQLTASAGIAANTLLAKVCSDMNKPNGQYFLPKDKKSVQDFIKELPIRKISGIGNVTEQHLRALGVVTCSDLWTHRGLIRLLFKETSYRYFLCIAMGIGSTRITPSAERDRKSISNETTFSGTSDKTKLFKLCEELCRDLSEEMVRKDIYGKVFTLKMKTTTFQVKTKAQSLMEYTQDVNVMISVAHKLLYHEMESVSPLNGSLSLRLLGVRMSNLVDRSQLDVKKQTTLTEMFFQKSKQRTNVDENHLNDSSNQEFLQVSSSVNRVIIKERECDTSSSACNPEKVKENTTNISNNNTSLNDQIFSDVVQVDDILTYTCPVCCTSKYNDVENLNKHIDICLNLETVQKLVKESNLAVGLSSEASTSSVCSKTTLIKSKRKSTGKHSKDPKRHKSQSNSLNTLHKYLELQ